MLQNLKGFRDFLSEDKKRRDYLETKFKQTFELFGFQPLETPTLEYADLLLGKYGDEADKLLYRFLDRGEREVALRYDQTVPTSRVLVQYKEQLPKYYRRYQIQNVFRADKPQKGRYREFTQCDIDIFNTKSPLADAEVLACVYNAFMNIGFKEVIIKVNDRQLLFNVLQPFATEKVDVYSIIQSIDKLDKMSAENVINELAAKGMEKDSAAKALDMIMKSEITPDLKQIVDYAKDLGVPEPNLQFTPTLARGLDYYTGMILEVVSPQYPNGSLAGGGRYDNLVKQLSGQDIAATGMSFGFDRIIDAMQDIGLFPDLLGGVKVMVGSVDESTLPYLLNMVGKLREQGIGSELYPEISDEIGKQIKYASQNKYKYVLLAGESEQKNNKLALKDLESGEQKEYNIEEIIQILKA